MNWISHHNKRPSERQKQQEFFRQHRRTAVPANVLENDVPHSPDSHLLQPEFRRLSPHQDVHHPPISESEVLISDPSAHSLSDLDFRTIGKLVKRDALKISTEVLNQEMMRRLCHHEPKPPTPENRAAYSPSSRSRPASSKSNVEMESGYEGEESQEPRRRNSPVDSRENVFFDDSEFGEFDRRRSPLPEASTNYFDIPGSIAGSSRSSASEHGQQRDIPYFGSRGWNGSWGPL